MAEMVSSVVIQESVSKILSGLVQKYEEKEETNANRAMERIEMAHIRLEAALQISSRWQFTDSSLLRWRSKLKRAAQECEETLNKCKLRILEAEQMEQEVRNSSLPKRIAYSTKSFVSSVFKRDNGELSRSIITRFEWYADGASEFLRVMELGGTPHCHVPFDFLINNPFAGKELCHKILQQKGHPLLQLWLSPFNTAEHGMEATLVLIKKEGTAPEGNIYFSMIVQLSESTDIVGIAVKGLQLIAPHVKCTVQNIINELTRLPTQDLSWMPSVYSCQKEHWDNLHSFATQWFRPNPLCCKQHDKHGVKCFRNLDMGGSSNVSLEPLVEFNLQWQVSLSVDSKQKTSLSEGKIYLQNSPYLKAGIAFAPHDSSEDMLIPANKSSEAVAIDGREQHLLHTDITLQQLEEFMVPKAIDYFCQNDEATVYQMIWKSKHGVARIQVEKPSMGTWRTNTRTRRTLRGPTKAKLFRGTD
ncbi:unnamed protein product [Urochloa humidicola]